MLQAIRDRATGWIAYGIIMLICIPFALWGINSYFQGGNIADVAAVAGEGISLQDFQRAYQNERARIQRIYGASFNPALFDEASMKSNVLQRMINEMVLEQTAEEKKLRIGDKRLNEIIQGLEVFQENGQFDNDKYRRMLSIQGNNPAAFEDGYRLTLATEQLRSGFASTSLLTKPELEQRVALLEQQRELSYILFQISSYTDKVELTDAAVQAYYDENKDSYNSEEQVKLQYLELDLDAVAADFEISEEELLSAYEQRKADQYTQEEQRRASYLLVGVAADADEETTTQARQRAEAIYQQISEGNNTFAAVLKEAEQDDTLDGGELGIIFRGNMDPTIEDAAFALNEKGSISEPVQTAFGFQIIHLDDLLPEQVQAFTEVKEELGQSLRKERADEIFFDAADTLANTAFENPDSLQPAADALNLELKETELLKRSERTDILRFPQATAAAYSADVLQQGLNSEALEVEPSHVIVLRVLEHIDAKPLTLEQARAQIETDLRNKLAREQAKKDAEDAQQRAENGETLAAIASSFALELNDSGLIKRSQPGVNPQIITKAFQLSKPDADKASYGIAALGTGDQVLLAVSSVVPGKVEGLEQDALDDIIENAVNTIGFTQFDGYVRSRREQADITTFPDRL